MRFTLRPAPFPDIAAERRRGLVAVFVLTLGLLLLSYGLATLVGGPRLFVYVLDVLAVTAVLWRAQRLDARTLGVLVAAAGVALVLGASVVDQVLLHGRGWQDVPIRWSSPLGVAATLGVPCLASIIAAYCVPRFRSDVASFARPQPPAIDAARLAVLAIVVAFALLTVGRALTGWHGFQMMPEQSEWAHQQRVAECTTSIADEFPEYTGSDLQEAINFCVESR